jgi:hypothetical protein
MRLAFALPLLLAGCVETAATFAIIEGAHHISKNESALDFKGTMEEVWPFVIAELKNSGFDTKDAPAVGEKGVKYDLGEGYVRIRKHKKHAEYVRVLVKYKDMKGANYDESVKFLDRVDAAWQKREEK